MYNQQKNSRFLHIGCKFTKKKKFYFYFLKNNYQQQWFSFFDKNFNLNKMKLFLMRRKYKKISLFLLKIFTFKMKKILTLSLLTIAFVSCEQKQEAKPEEAKVDYAVFGDSISSDGALTSSEMMEKFKSMKEGDTLEVKFKSGINEVCQKKGCWMTLDLADDKEAFVKFKDYGFFVPKNAQDKEVIVNGKAFVSVESVDVLKHYAKDAGKSQAAIDSITEPKVTYSFMADGVLIAK